MPFKFTGAINKVTIELKPSNLSPADKKLLEEEQSAAAAAAD